VDECKPLAPGMNTQNVANTVSSFLALAATRGVPLPACQPSLWKAALALDTGSLTDLGKRNLFHAHLMHTEAWRCRETRVCKHAIRRHSLLVSD